MLKVYKHLTLNIVNKRWEGKCQLRSRVRRTKQCRLKMYRKCTNVKYICLCLNLLINYRDQISSSLHGSVVMWCQLVESKRKVTVHSVYTCDQLSVTLSLNCQKTLVCTTTTPEQYVLIWRILSFEAQNATEERRCHCSTHRVWQSDKRQWVLAGLPDS